MKYIGKTLQFLNRNFIYLLVFCLIPAILIVADYDVSALIDLFLRLWTQGGSVVPSEIFEAMTFLIKPTFWLALIVIVVLLFSACLCFSYVDRKMRIGVSSLTKPFRKINEVLVSVFSVGIVLLGAYELLTFLFSNLLTLLARLDSVALQAVLVPLLLLLFYAGVFYLCTMAVNWIPLMMLPGYRFSEAFGVSVRMSQGHGFGLMIGLAFPFLVTIPFMILAKTYLNFMLLDSLICVIGHTIQIAYVVSYCMVVYFDMSGRERADLKSYLSHSL